MINLVSTITFFAGAAGFASLGISIWQRAKRTSEVRVLLLMLAVFTLQCLVLSLDALLFGILGIIPALSHAFFAALEPSLSLLAIGTVFHFVFLTYSKALDESGLLADPFSPLRNYRGQYWFWLVASYSMPAASIGTYTYLAFRAWREHPAGQLTLPPAPQKFFGIVGIFFLYLAWTLALLYRRRPSIKKNSFLDRLLTPLGNRLSDASVLRLHLSDYQQHRHNQDVTLVTQDEWVSGLLLALWTFIYCLTFIVFAIVGGSIPSDGWRGVLRYLLPSVFIVPLIYFKMRFVFFDILIKRYLIAMMLLVAGVIYCGLILIPIYDRLSGVGSTAAPLILYAGTTLFGACWLAVYGRLNRMLDRCLFRRSDYGKTISEIDAAMKQFVEPDGLLNDVKSRLHSALDAERIEFIPLQNEPTWEVQPEFQSASGKNQRQLLTAEIPVSTSEMSYGSLRFGRRAGRFRYQSEDLAFLTTVAGHLAEMLRNFELQSERAAQQLRERHLQMLAEQAELRALRAQINPHFLFNALNSLAELSQKDSNEAEAAILHLSHVFRYALDASRHESTFLEEELGFVESYLAIERLRFENGLHYKITISPDARGCRLPPMVIQPIVENAVKHGLSRKLGGGIVKIDASVVEGKLQVVVEDDGLGFDPKSLGRPKNQGVGIENVRGRLERIAGPGSFRITSKPNVGTKVCFSLVCQRDTVSPKGIPVSNSSESGDA